MINRNRLCITTVAILLSTPVMAELSGFAGAFGKIFTDIVSVVDPATGEEVFEDDNVVFTGQSSINVAASANGFNDLSSGEDAGAYMIANEGPFVVTLTGEISVEASAATDIFDSVISEATFFDSNAFIEISGPASLSGFASTNGTYSCLETDVFCEEVLEFDNDLDITFFNITLNPGDSVTFNYSATAFTFFETPSLVVDDVDNDDIADTLDNCVVDSNADQIDTDGDGYGNVCDPDFNNDCVVNFLDISAFSNEFLGTNPVFDLNGDGEVNFLDFSVVSSEFLQSPGPSGVTNICD